MTNDYAIHASVPADTRAFPVFGRFDYVAAFLVLSVFACLACFAAAMVSA